MCGRVKCFIGSIDGGIRLIKNLDETEHKEVVSIKTGELYTLSKCLSKNLGIENIGFYHETISPHRRSSAAHYHTTQDEIFYILKGHPVVVVNGQETQLKQGDYMGFRSGVAAGHFLKNESSESVEFLIICTTPNNDEVIYT